MAARFGAISVIAPSAGNRIQTRRSRTLGQRVQRETFPSRQLAAHLRRGGLIAYPTESCYGFGCDPDNRRAVLRLLKLKQRPQRKGLILIASHYRQVARYLAPLTSAEQARLQHDGAQAITYLMPVRSSCPRWLRGEHDTLAVRLTAHPLARQLCRSAGRALVSTSANLSGQRPVRTYAECRRLFGKQVWVLRGKVGKRKRPSTIRTWMDGRIIRN
ncbi:threonylcarbamoyl-AMP synthase [mine drainage metagenome]|uniref:L-threonylcarbamoyladenylate synthase n=1 Tax=mine drainage metagenome TaxID=410659 RepID=A0A1J5T9E8_9ZZZZ